MLVERLNRSGFEANYVRPIFEKDISVSPNGDIYVDNEDVIAWVPIVPIHRDGKGLILGNMQAMELVEELNADTIKYYYDSNEQLYKIINGDVFAIDGYGEEHPLDSFTIILICLHINKI